MARLRGLALISLLVGCGGGAPPISDVTSGSPAGSVSEPTLGAGVSQLESACFEEERCDGLDSDCDGHIDEGCEGAAPGALEVALAWSGQASLTLELSPSVELPDGAARVDGCADLGPHVERRSSSSLAPGEYRVSVARAGACDADGPTTASVTIALRGRRLGTYNVLVEDGSAEVVRFSVAR